MTQLQIRKPAEGEAAAVAARGEPNISAQTVREWLDDPAIDIRVAFDAEEPACYGDMMVAPDGTRVHLDLREHPDHQGSAAVLLDTLEAAAAERGATVCRAYGDRAETSYVVQRESRSIVRPRRHPSRRASRFVIERRARSG